LPLQEGLYRAAAARRALQQALAHGPWDVIVVQMLRCGWAATEAARLAPQTPLLFDAIDAMGLHFRRAAAGFPAPLRPLVRNEAARCQARETWLVERSAVVTAVSQRDLEALGAPADAARVVPVSGREVAVAEPGQDNIGGPPTVLLSGNLGYRPTVLGALWFAREVWPRVQRQVADARWILAGARPAAKVRRLDRLDGVEVHADVPDLDAYVARATVAIAPMWSGSGVPMKVLEAWAAGVPVVADPWAAAGLDPAAQPALQVAQEAAEWVSRLTHLLTDRGAASDLGDRGRAAWDRIYRPQRVVEAIRAAVERAAAAG
jgi:glycosyltransferase involved in cell wall biosynthesis